MKDLNTIAAYICNRYQAENGERIDEMKLHKLLYFAQRESLIRNREPLFEGEFQGWRYGPVLPAIRAAYRDDTFPTDIGDIGDAKAIMDDVFENYSQKDSWSLSRLTHGEISWKKSRAGIEPGEAGANVIPLADIRLDADRMRQRRAILDQMGRL